MITPSVEADELERTGEHCAGCGYDRVFHGLGNLRCPEAKTAKFREAVAEPRKEWLGLSVPLSPAELKARAAAADVPVVVSGPPQVPARPPLDPGEFAGYQRKQAVGLGRQAVAAGWDVRPLYWRSHDGTEGCGVWLVKGVMRAVATWQRKPGKLGAKSGWSADVAYAWRADVERFPTNLNHTDLERFIT